MNPTEGKKIPVRIVTTRGFDTKPRGPIVVEEGEGNWVGPKGVLKFFKFAERFPGRYRTLIAKWNGILGILKPDAVWTKRDMGLLVWDLFLMEQHLEGMLGKMREIREELAGYHGYAHGAMPEGMENVETPQEIAAWLNGEEGITAQFRVRE